MNVAILDNLDNAHQMKFVVMTAHVVNVVKMKNVHPGFVVVASVVQQASDVVVTVSAINVVDMDNVHQGFVVAARVVKIPSIVVVTVSAINVVVPQIATPHLLTVVLTAYAVFVARMQIVQHMLPIVVFLNKVVVCIGVTKIHARK
jgi:hypothetical protein